MTETTALPALPERFRTGIEGVDTILGGGLFRAGIYIVAGRPGAGKTIFANQICFNHAKAGGRAMYVTLLAETHERMLSQLRVLSFFEADFVGDRIRYLNGFAPLEAEGLTGLLQLVRGMVREHQASFLVLDGIVTAEHLAKSTNDYKKFINELQTWVGLLGCTVLILASGEPDGPPQPAHTMVDGTFELETARSNARALRYFTVTKFRGGGFVEGHHHYAITSEGIRVYPRVEASLVIKRGSSRGGRRCGSGVRNFDGLIDGGFAERSTTLVLGPSGSGKTLWGMSFLAEGLRQGENGLHFGFFENPPTLTRTAGKLGLDYEKALESGALRIIWHKAAEQLMDALAYEILEDVKARNVKRLFLDGLVGFKEASNPDRISAFFATLVEELAERGVTTLISEETRELFVRHVEIPTQGASAIFENILYLRMTDAERELARIVSVMKTRDAAHTHLSHEFEVVDGEGLIVTAEWRHTGDLRFGGGQPDRAELSAAKARKKKRKLLRRKGGGR